MINIVTSSAWQALREHCRKTGSVHLRTLFRDDPQRAAAMTIEACGLFVDFSKNRVTADTLRLLLALAEEAGLAARITAMFAGDKINCSEHRAALHIALRASASAQYHVDSINIMPEVLQLRNRMLKFADQVHGGEWKGHSGAAITDVVNLGIGGSELGTRLVCSALKDHCHPRIRAHFVSGVDGVQIDDVLKQIRPETSLFIIASKSFTTQETLINAHTARDWLLAHTNGDAAAIARHFVAVSTNRRAVKDFGIDEHNMFGFHDWVGGRYSLWSAIGLPVAICNGSATFHELLEGAREMDEHFRSAPFARNLPVILALLGIWNIDFLAAPTHLIAAYHQRLYRLPAYLQQLDMESNGKSVTIDGRPVGCATSPVVWGETGINGQHAYFQMVHQGTQLVAVDFIGVLDRGPRKREHELAFAHMLAQAEALMCGRTAEEAASEMRRNGLPEARIQALTPHRTFPGNRPSNTLLLERLDARCLGALLALYEHRTFVQGTIWQINSFDQWGVELGKQLAAGVMDAIHSPEGAAAHDASTRQLIERYRQGGHDE